MTLAALYNLAIIIIRLTFSDMAANVSPKEHLKWIQCQSINMSIISRVLLALCNACIIGVNSNTFRNSTLTLILINLLKIDLPLWPHLTRDGQMDAGQKVIRKAQVS